MFAEAAVEMSTKRGEYLDRHFIAIIRWACHALKMKTEKKIRL
jgi:hypothetical protein